MARDVKSTLFVIFLVCFLPQGFFTKQPDYDHEAATGRQFPIRACRWEAHRHAPQCHIVNTVTMGSPLQSVKAAAVVKINTACENSGCDALSNIELAAGGLADDRQDIKVRQGKKEGYTAGNAMGVDLDGAVVVNPEEMDAWQDTEFLVSLRDDDRGTNVENSLEPCFVLLVDFHLGTAYFLASLLPDWTTHTYNQQSWFALINTLSAAKEALRRSQWVFMIVPLLSPRYPNLTLTTNPQH